MTTTAPEFNVALAKRVRDRIADLDDSHLDMGEFFGYVGDIECALLADGDPGCGTTACIAGWTLAVERGAWTWRDFGYDSDPVARAAAEALGLDLTGGPSNVRLFYTSYWPDEIRALWLTDEADGGGDKAAMLRLLDDLIDGRRDPNTLALVP